MKILVTGGAGFMGSNFIKYVLEKYPDYEIINLDKLTYAGNRSSLVAVEADARHVFVHGDICDSALFAALLREHRIDAVMHLAAESHVDRSIDNPDEFVMTNIVGTYRLLETFRRYLAETGRLADSAQPLAAGGRSAFLHVSTDEVFGSLGPADPPFHEDTRYAPNSPYSASKAGSDHLARAYHHTYGLPVITTNCSNNYGPYQFPEKLLPLMIRKTLKGEPLPVYGDGANVRDWLYVGDHCRGLASALWRGLPGRSYAIGGNCELQNIDVVRAIIDTVRELAPEQVLKSAADLITYVKDRPGHDRRYAINSARITRELGWQPRENFASGLRKTVQWYLDHEDWVRAIEDGTYSGQRLGSLEPGN